MEGFSAGLELTEQADARLFDIAVRDDERLLRPVFEDVLKDDIEAGAPGGFGDNFSADKIGGVTWLEEAWKGDWMHRRSRQSRPVSNSSSGFMEPLTSR
jgi:hypothetical protein